MYCMGKGDHASFCSHQPVLQPLQSTEMLTAKPVWFTIC